MADPLRGHLYSSHRFVWDGPSIYSHAAELGHGLVNMSAASIT